MEIKKAPLVLRTLKIFHFLVTLYPANTIGGDLGKEVVLSPFCMFSYPIGTV
jgi:hypothetical protein